MNVLKQLEAWYTSHCNEEWEENHGVSIQSCDNPGWWVKIDLEGTDLLNKPFKEVVRGDVVGNMDPQPPWLHCYIENTKWHGAGDQSTLEEILQIFLDWTNGS